MHGALESPHENCSVGDFYDLYGGEKFATLSELVTYVSCISDELSRYVALQRSMPGRVRADRSFTDVIVSLRLVSGGG